MSLPSTPSTRKANAEIKKIVYDLVQKWNLQLPIRDATWSPSKSTNEHIDQQILSCIRFLFFKDRSALDSAITRFEQHAKTIQSEWRFKPRAESDVIPYRTEYQSAKREEFLAVEVALDEKVSANLKECLLAKIKPVYECVKKDEKYTVGDEKARDISVQTQSEVPKLPRTQNSYGKTSPLRTSKIAKPPSPRSGSKHPSSDDFFSGLDDSKDWEDIIMTDAPKTLERSESTEEEYKTPPSEIPSEKANEDDFVPQIPGKAPTRPEVSKKRPHPEIDPLQPPAPRKASWEKRRSSGRSHDINSMEPTNSTSNYNHPMQRYGAQKQGRSSTDLSRSFGSTSSFLTTATAATTPNTSFNFGSVATSFDSSLSRGDKTIRNPVEARQSDEVADSRYPRTSSEPPQSTQEDFGSSMDYELALESSELIDYKSEQAFPTPAKTRASSVRVGGKITGTDAAQYLHKYLITQSPTAKPVNHAPSNAPFRQLYEVERISRFCNIPKTCFIGCLEKSQEYSSLWASLSTLAEKFSATLPERSNSRAWEKAVGDFRDVSLSGELKYSDKAGGPLFNFELRPLKLDASYRLARKYGGDRVFTVSLPGLDSDDLPRYLRDCSNMVRDKIVKWIVYQDHYFLGRRWRAFYVKPEPRKNRDRRLPKTLSEPKFRIFMFAEDGDEFRKRKGRDEIDTRSPVHTPVTICDMINWFMPAAHNRDKRCLQFFSRLALAVSSTVPTVVFKPEEIIKSDDALAVDPRERRLDDKQRQPLGGEIKSESAVMNDGCARISRAAANGIAEKLGLTQTPSNYQGRIGGAKGVWMVDALDEHHPESERDYWIEITTSQLKFRGHPEDSLYPDELRTMFEVNDWSKKLGPATLNFQLIPILEDRGVPCEVFQRLLHEDLTSKVADLKHAMADPASLRKWNQDNNPVAGERLANNGVEMLVGVPKSLADRINWFLEHGFKPQSCSVLKDYCYKAVHDYCTRLENSMHIGIGRSTSAFMIADPLAVLEEGEIHLKFSNVFEDPNHGRSDTELHGIDLLVARSPALLPSDVQKVRAVYKTELRMYKDVIVFSSKGERSLADKLSGGDYDGDKAWICWEPDIVGPFENALVPPSPPPAYYGIEETNLKMKDIIDRPDYLSQFLHHAFHFNLQSNLLGSCTAYHEAYCYKINSIHDEKAIAIAQLLGKLVDRAKAGYSFDDVSWYSFLKGIGLPNFQRKPAYKDKGGQRPTKHTIDRLVFEVAANVRERVLQDFTVAFAQAGTWDDDLGRLWNLEYQRAKQDEDLIKVREDLRRQLKLIFEFWKSKVTERGDELDMVKPLNRKDGVSMTFRALAGYCRNSFLAIQPLEGITHSVVDRWRSEIETPTAIGGSWRYIKASALFYLWHKSGKFVWYVAGLELGEIKAQAKGLDTYHTIVGGLYEFYKMDGKMLRRSQGRESGNDAFLTDDKQSNYGSDIEDFEGVE